MFIRVEDGTFNSEHVVFIDDVQTNGIANLYLVTGKSVRLMKEEHEELSRLLNFQVLDSTAAYEKKWKKKKEDTGS